MISRMFVGFYRFVHGRLHWPGAGWLLRHAAIIFPGLRSFPLVLPGVGTALVDFRDESIFVLLNYSLGERGSDWSLLSAMSQVLRPGDVLWDVGANVGYVSQHFAREKFHLAEIHAFEPNPSVVTTLRSLFRDRAQVCVHAVGLGAQDEERQIRIDPRGSSTGSLVADLPGAKTVSIKICRADRLRNESGLAAPAVVKVDVEGFEPQVFAGMQQTIQQARPIIFFEHIWIDDESVRRLVPAGYDLTFLLDDGTLTRDFTARRQGANAILTPSEKAGMLGSRVTWEGAL